MTFWILSSHGCHLQVAWGPPGPAAGLAGLLVHLAGAAPDRLVRVLSAMPKGALGRLLQLPIGLPLLYAWAAAGTKRHATF